MKNILLAQAQEIQRQIAALRRHYAEARSARAAAGFAWCAA
jgi:prefoldin subunit 5